MLGQAHIKYSDSFISNLKRLNLYAQGKKESTGLVFVDEDPTKIHSSEIFALEKAKELKATAVYFRRYPNRHSIPQIYVYDFSSGDPTGEQLANINKEIWSSSVVPLAYVIYQTSLTVIDCTKPIQEKGTNITASFLVERLSLIAEVNTEIENYRAELFDTGLFWEKHENIRKFQFRNSAYEKLLEYLKHVRTDFIKKSKLSDDTAQKLIVQSILLKYLEEREDIHGNHVFPPEYFKKYGNSKNFCDVLSSKGQCVKLFDDLNKNKFNGKIFEWTDEDGRAEIANTDLSVLAQFLDSHSNKHGQLAFWRQYSFSHLPVELISRIYEEFLGNNKDGLVYTPPHLVNFLIDECLPLTRKPDEISLDIKIFDPSCGSGIFLVSAFKRLVQLWRIKHGLKKPAIASLKKILKECIYGVDIEPKAVQLTTFSLSLAICDLLTPTEIWHELRFDNLKEENITSMDFFLWNKSNTKKFDLIVGNPPFIRGGLKAEDSWEIDEQTKISYPQNQIALKFLCESMNLLKDGGLQCLILPAGNLFYNSSIVEFRKAFFYKYHVIQVLDFSALSRNHVLWDNAEVPTAAVFTRKATPNFKKNVLHVTVRRTKAAAERILFEIDEYDLHYIRRQAAAESKFVWKGNLLGGGRIHDLINRFEDCKTIDEFIEGKFKTGEGYIVGTGGRPAPFLDKIPSLPTDAFDELGIHYSRLEKQTSKRFARPKEEELYKAPNILIKSNIGDNRIPIALNNRTISFKSKIFAITASKKDAHTLKDLYEFFQSSMDLYRFLIFAQSGQILLNKNTTYLTEDFMRLPINKELKPFKINKIEKMIIQDTLNYYQEFFRHGENSEVLSAIPDNNDSLVNGFIDAFLLILNGIIQVKNRKLQAVEVFHSPHFIAVHFSYTNETNKPKRTKLSDTFSKETVEKIFSSKINNSVIAKRMIKMYKGDSVILIKPNQVRFWLKTVAFRDADRVLADLATIKTEYAG